MTNDLLDTTYCTLHTLHVVFAHCEECQHYLPPEYKVLHHPVTTHYLQIVTVHVLCPHVEVGHHEPLPPPTAGQAPRPRGQAAVLHTGV